MYGCDPDDEGKRWFTTISGKLVCGCENGKPKPVPINQTIVDKIFV